jgi:hypothetical protein
MSIQNIKMSAQRACLDKRGGAVNVGTLTLLIFKTNVQAKKKLKNFPKTY